MIEIQFLLGISVYCPTDKENTENHRCGSIVDVPLILVTNPNRMEISEENETLVESIRVRCSSSIVQRFRRQCVTSLWQIYEAPGAPLLTPQKYPLPHFPNFFEESHMLTFTLSSHFGAPLYPSLD